MSAGRLSASQPVAHDAQQLALSPEELGEGWRLDSEKTDPEQNYSPERSADGRAFIAVRPAPAHPLFDPALIDNLNLRGYSQPEQGEVLFLIAAVFKDSASAEQVAQERLSTAGRDGGLPAENYTYQAVFVGDEATLVSVRNHPEDPLPFATTLQFRKGAVWVELISVGRWDDLAQAPAVSEARLAELAKIIAARIR